MMKTCQFCYTGYDFRVKNVQAEELDIRFKISTVPSLPQIILPPFHLKSKSLWLTINYSFDDDWENLYPKYLPNT